MLIGIGAVQYGLMYSLYIQAFRYLPAHAIALFTIFTPLYVTLFNDGLERRFRPGHLLLALLAIAGAFLIQYEGRPLREVSVGFILLQASNLCFAFGQVAYRRFRLRREALSDRSIFALLYFGALVVTALATTGSGGWNSVARLDREALLTLLYLGLIASGLCFFWWNLGAVRSNAATLAVLNNLKIPLGVLFSLLLFGETLENPALSLIGATIMIGAGVAAEWRSRHAHHPEA